ncbi:hypothetical protein HRbin36_00468 [bacterium HR36]|nr:hypothetical protein HRbin36_00468 [bacterium HR36]
MPVSRSSRHTVELVTFALKFPPRRGFDWVFRRLLPVLGGAPYNTLTTPCQSRLSRKPFPPRVVSRTEIAHGMGLARGLQQ